MQQLTSHDLKADIHNLATKLWGDAAVETADSPAAHPFFERHGVFVPGLRIYRGSLMLDGVRCDGDLMAPMFDRGRSLQNIALIPVSGERKYLARDRINGLFFGIGKYPGDSETTIVVTAGLVAALKARKALACPVAVAFTDSNVAAVAELMAQRYARAQILIPGVDGKLFPFEHQKPRQESAATDQQTTVMLRPLVAQASAEPASDVHAKELAWAQKLVAWAKRRELTEFNRKMVLQLGPSSVRPVARAEAALARLIAFGWLETQDAKSYRLTEAARVELQLVSTPPSAKANAEQSLATSGDAEVASQESAS